ncbi:unnamed protein product [Blepharisma stoltei]|uniref:Secreted protein n=1 Tax=Blepharisma stoltei TaxID=1481888 RepID=A0AAU9JP52_9CILI|nr:unnamed protein product [Blepharisma stoltei]
MNPAILNIFWCGIFSRCGMILHMWIALSNYSKSFKMNKKKVIYSAKYYLIRIFDRYNCPKNLVEIFDFSNCSEK